MMSRLDGLDVDIRSDTQGSQDMDWNERKAETRKYGAKLMGGQRAPRAADTLSDIDDPYERDKIFRHSMQGGLMKNISDSPLKNRMPHTLQMYESDKVEQPQAFSKKQVGLPFDRSQKHLQPDSKGKQAGFD